MNVEDIKINRQGCEVYNIIDELYQIEKQIDVCPVLGTIVSAIQALQYYRDNELTKGD